MKFDNKQLQLAKAMDLCFKAHQGQSREGIMMDEAYWKSKKARKEAQEDLDVAIKKVVSAGIKKVVSAGNAEIKELLVQMMNYSPEVGFPKWVKPAYHSEGVESREEYREREGLNDPNLPFFSEIYLYEMFGKEDARTILSFLGSLARAIGYNGLWELKREVRKQNDDV